MNKNVRGSMNGMTNPTRDDLAKLGYNVVLSGKLHKLRESVHMTRNAQSRLIGVEPESLVKWESLDRAMNIETAVRIGEWYWGAMKVLDESPEIEFRELVCASKAAQYLGIPVGELETSVSQRGLPHEDLGVLGIFIYKHGLTVALDF